MGTNTRTCVKQSLPNFFLVGSGVAMKMEAAASTLRTAAISRMS